MASITSSTKHSVPGTKKKVVPSVGKKLGAAVPKKAGAKRGSAPPLVPATLATEASKAALQSLDRPAQQAAVKDLFRQALGEASSVLDSAKPHQASTTRSRGGAAADVAVAAKLLGMPFLVTPQCGVLDEISRLLFPDGIEALLNRNNTNSENGNTGGGLKASASAVSLTSLDFDDTTTVTTANSGGTDSKRGKSAPPNAREGALLVLRALCEHVQRPAEPYVVGALLAAALDECGSTHSNVREAAVDTSTAMVALASPWAFPSIVCPLLLHALEHSTEWRVKLALLERLEQTSGTSPRQVHLLIPTLLPVLTSQVFDTKAQVAKAAKQTLLAICKTNTNADIRPAIPAIVQAMCKPSEINQAVSALMGTTFVVPVDASTLAILCPALARALKEKLAIHKRAACLVISNMAKLVEKPEAVAPFGSLLVPELHRMAESVQFEEIRDEALKALAALTKALGDSYKVQEDRASVESMELDQAKVEAEQERIRAKRAAEAQKDQEIADKEEQERKLFKEAMDAQRELDKLALHEATEKKEQDDLQKEKLKSSTKGASGQCQACGLKKCKKSCLFFGK